MSFADEYLIRENVSGNKIDTPPNNDLNQIIVIPCYNEPDMISSLESLFKCQRPNCSIEIVVVINSSVSAPQEVKDRNDQTYKEVLLWSKEKSGNQFRCFPVRENNLPEKTAGPGLARKIGMDLSITRFNKTGNRKGIIISFDADAACEPDYLIKIEDHFIKHPKTTGCAVYFEHPVSGSDFPAEVYQAIIQYELHLRYYIEAIRYTGYPYAFHTVGSCFCITAETYVKQGGMNKRKAGEDFYFLQKVFHLGHFYEINSTCVYPSPRPSGRVPFGTGPSILKFINEKHQYWKSYNLLPFFHLKEFYSSIDTLFRADYNTLQNIYNGYHISVQDFLSDAFFYKISEINTNSSNIVTFRKRFHLWFNMFKILKYLNFAHEKYFPKVPVEESVKEWFRLNNSSIKEEKPVELLRILRKIQKDRQYFVK